MTVLLPRKPKRRSVLRGAFGGIGASVALPFLDCFLDNNGTALAATGERLPVRFGTWFWGLGFTPGAAIKDKTSTGSGIEFLDQCKLLKPFEKHLNYFSGFTTPLDGRSNYVHVTGWVATRTGTVPAAAAEIAAPTLDLLIADISGASRFQTLDLCACNQPRENYSARSANSHAAAEISPVSLYARLFGPDFVDPNNVDFKPDPMVMLNKSVLSFVGDPSKEFNKSLGASDKARLDEYFTSIRQLETQLAAQLERPPRNAACMVPPHPDNIAAGEGLEVETVHATHKLMAGLLAMAVACNQTKVFNMTYSDSFSRLRKAGETYYYHQLSHEEAPDPVLGYQPHSHWFACKAMEAFADFIETFAKVREGDGTLLDNTLVFASTETNFARTHTVDGIPIFFVGKAGGRLKTGMHVVGGGGPITRVGLTALQTMGVPIDKWGTQSLQTSKPIRDIMV